MGFDAGAITAHMKLDRTEFDDDADAVEERGKELSDEKIVVDASIDRDKFDADADEIGAKKDELEKAVDVPVKLETDEFDVEAAEVEAEKEALGRAVDIPVKLNPDEAVAEAVVAREAINHALTGSANSPQFSLVKTLLGSMDEGDAARALQQLNGGALSDAKKLISDFNDFQIAEARRLSVGLLRESEYALRGAGGSAGYALPWGPIPGIAETLFGSQAQIGQGSGGGGLTQYQGPGSLVSWLDKTLGGGGTSYGSGGGFFNGASSGAADLGGAGGAGESAASAFAKAWRAAATADMQNGEYSLFQKMTSEYSGSPFKVLFKGASGVEDDLRKWADKAGVDVGDRFVKAMSKGATDAAKAAAGDGGFFSGIIGSLASGAGKASSGISSFLGGIGPGLSAGLVGAPLLVPIVGALGAATGGAIAGTSIGLAGTVAALLPGVLDLLHGYSAYSAEKAGTSTAGMSQGSLDIAAAIKPLMDGSTGFLGSLETQVNPEIVSFLNALAKALPLIGPFAEQAVSSMSKFFGIIDSGLASGGFKSFMGTMTKDVGPIMDDFGRFILNIGGAFGGFLKLFGGTAAQMVGAWFDRVSKGLDSFTNNAKLAPAFLAGMLQSFNFLGSALDVVWRVMAKISDALAPIGLTAMKVLTPAFQGLAMAVGAIPTNALTAIALGLAAIGIASIANPVLLVAGALVLLGLAIKGVSSAMASLHPLSFKELTQAFAGDLTAPGKRTAAEIAALSHANALGYTPATIGQSFFALRPNAPTAGGRGLSSSADSAPAPGASASQIAAWNKNQPKAPDPQGWVRWEAALGGALKDVGGALEAFQRFFGRTLSGIEDFLNNSIPNAVGHFVNFWKRGWDDASSGAYAAYQFIVRDVVNPVVNFFTQTIPHAFDVTIKWFKSLPSKIVAALGDGFKLLNHWGTDLVRGVVSGIEHAAGSVGNAFGAIFNAIGGGINKGINWLNDHDPSLFGVSMFPKIPDIPKFADGGWVGGPIGAPQLAIVHGGEFVQSRKMLANGGGGMTVQISVDARGSANPAAVQQSAISGVNSVLPALRRVLKASSVPGVAA
jgi:hypothetical protein